MSTEPSPAPEAGLFRPLAFAAGPMCLFAAFLSGGVMDRVRGCENTTIVAAGSPEGELYTQHGVPDRVVELQNPLGPNVRHWSRYVVEWDVEEEHRQFVTSSQRRSTIGYLVENGKVVNGGYVGMGHGASILTEVDLSNDPRGERVGGAR